ncbi:hypothetical protein RO3G_10876 [Rhizopus delemar RA 99-880]|uniref:Tc1-like transposase DDE domain-containing protein n=1 Tax=Rhizopus delemar (strain RA 99-880 / ATCC MYA-4621 / FGSC 9543 / NRRL 43880) TaxID=246409 RepID=I1CCI5_RHIO9|nr:hypothetical protein RO3G_10876 [Rhizopus delemar RA 99-880]|eukprot:EIE86165.1 hypothetical protein RO3G_10876 [Rhizopus delemar RA 99-880]
MVKERNSQQYFTVPTAKANATSILGAIFATSAINVSLRIPRRIKKRKFGRAGDGYSTGIATLDEMDKYSEMKGHYLIIDNTPIHSSFDIGKYIHSGRYRYVYIPPYSPELNPTVQVLVSRQEQSEEK